MQLIQTLDLPRPPRRRRPRPRRRRHQGQPQITRRTRSSSTRGSSARTRCCRSWPKSSASNSSTCRTPRSTPDVLAAMPQKLVHRKNLMPRRPAQRHPRRRHRRPVRRLRARRTANAHRPARPCRCSASPREIARLIKHALRRRRRHRHRARRRSEGRGRRRTARRASRPTTARLAKQAQEASVVKLVNEILVEAANERASDIHVEPEENGLRIRYRIDGLLQTQNAAAGDQPLPGGDRQPHQDHGPAQHRREAAAAGRPHQDAACRAARSTSACRSSR